MSIIWAESFDLYGTSIAALLLRGYTTPGTTVTTVNNTGGRTGPGFFQSNSSSSSNRGITRVLDTPLNTVGSGVAMATMDAGSDTYRNHGLAFGVGGNGFAYKVSTGADLSLKVYNGTTLLGSSAPNVITIGPYFWVEMKIINNIDGGGGAANTGSIEVRCNGDVVLVINGVNITSAISSVSLGNQQSNSGGGSTYTMRWDDWVIWDTNGTVNNDFLGDRRCFTSMPDADTAFADWSLSTGVDGYALIDELSPSDADYIQADNPGDISEFEKAPIGIDTNDIAAVVVIGRALKTDAGASSFRLGVHSGAFVENSEEFLPSTSAAYFSAVFERDPNGDIQWNQTSVDAATIRVTREV